MISAALTELLAGTLAGGGLQVVSEVFKLGGGLVASLRDAAVSNNEQYRANVEAHTAARTAAAKGNPTWLRAALALIVFTSAFILTFYAGWLEMPTSLVSEGMQTSVLWGLFKSVSDPVVTTATGCVQGPDFWSTVRVVAGAIFGVGAVSTGKRFL